MMRSMYSGVSGLKTHQTKMDVIGNNIANVNTVGFKSSSVTFSEIMYQNLSGASGPNALTGTGGVNAKQIGLGVTTGSTSVNITGPGASQTTGGAFDIKLNDTNSATSFFIVSNGSGTQFTRAGSFYVDGAGNLCMTSTGYNVMGWQVDPTTGDIRKDTVSALRVMSEKNMTSAPEATVNGRCEGVLDKNSTDVTSEAGQAMNLSFYDALGYSYVAKFAIKETNRDTGEYTVELTDILDSTNKSILDQTKYDSVTGTYDPDYLGDIFGAVKSQTKTYTPRAGWTTVDAANNIFEYNATYYRYDAAAGNLVEVADNGGGNYVQVPGGTTKTLAEAFGVSPYATGITMTNGVVTANVSGANYTLKFNPDDGVFDYIGANGQDNVFLNLKDTLGGNFEDIDIDFTGTKWFDNGGSSTIGMDKGDVDGKTGTGKKLGDMIGVFVDTNGKIYGTYDNGNTILLGQIAVAQFANAMGLEKVGDNCYTTTLNSGEFDGIGVDITAGGGTMSTGMLEMSNVDLSSEFTEMITTQRGFQANSRIITVSDTLLEELINLKR
ncbi:MAG: flagellar hook-basal body complex protein [Lachnospiraceae bacterium]|mgnify:FL=1|nr:flagellar hook-basal body complex protein [Lachnospiraceae bacterium]